MAVGSERSRGAPVRRCGDVAGARGVGRSAAVMPGSRSAGRARVLHAGRLSTASTEIMQRKPRRKQRARRRAGLRGPASARPHGASPRRRSAVSLPVGSREPFAGRGAPRGSAPGGCCTYRNGARCRTSPLSKSVRRCTASPPSGAGAAPPPGAALNVSAALSRVRALLWAAALRFVHRR